MAGWFDERAKRTAQRETESLPPQGISRRRMIQRTAVVGTAAWAIPTIVSAAPAWAACTGATTVTCGTTCCATGSVCGQQANTCYVTGSAGAACTGTGTSTCTGGRTCQSGFCQAAPGAPAGGACTSDAGCASSLVCVSVAGASICLLPSNVATTYGAACNNSGGDNARPCSTLNGLTCDKPTGNGTCKRTVGSFCASADVCASGRCTNTVVFGQPIAGVCL